MRGESAPLTSPASMQVVSRVSLRAPEGSTSIHTGAGRRDTPRVVALLGSEMQGEEHGPHARLILQNTPEHVGASHDCTGSGFGAAVHMSSGTITAALKSDAVVARHRTTRVEYPVPLPQGAEQSDQARACQTRVIG